MISCSGHQETNTKTDETETQYTGKWGYIDKAGNMVIEPQFDCAWNHSEGLAPVNIGRQLGYIDRKGNMVIEPKFAYWSREPFPKDKQHYDHDIYFYDGYARILKDGNYGFIDSDGNIAIEPVFDQAMHFSDGLAAVLIDGKWGFIDTTGRLAIEAQFSGVAPFSEGLALFWNEDGIGFIDTNGNIVIEPRFQEAGWFSEGRVVVTFQKESGDLVWGYVDAKGDWAVGPENFTGNHLLIHQCYFSEGFAVFQNGYVDRDGNTMIKGGGYPFSEGFALVATHNEDGSLSYGFIDKEGNWIIEPRFEFADSFSEGLALVKVEGKYGFVDESGHFVIEPVYSNALSFSDGLAPVKVR
jgi:WG containing repeat